MNHRMASCWRFKQNKPLGTKRRFTIVLLLPLSFISIARLLRFEHSSMIFMVIWGQTTISCCTYFVY